MGVFSSSSKSSKTKQEAFVDQVTSDEATSVVLENLVLGKKAKVSIDFSQPSLPALEVAGKALLDAGDVLRGSFADVLDFASQGLSQSNALAAELAAGPQGSAIAPQVLGQGRTQNLVTGGTTVLIMAAVGVGLLFVLRK